MRENLGGSKQSFKSRNEFELCSFLLAAYLECLNILLMEMVIQKRSLSSLKEVKKGEELKSPAERLAAMAVICKTRSQDGRVERRFRRVRKAS